MATCRSILAELQPLFASAFHYLFICLFWLNAATAEDVDYDDKTIAAAASTAELLAMIISAKERPFWQLGDSNGPLAIVKLLATTCKTEFT